MPPFWLTKICSYGLAAVLAAWILGVRWDRRVSAVIAGSGMGLLFWIEATYPGWRVDAVNAWLSGRHLLAGESPYGEAILNPPTCFPLFVLFAVFPQTVFLLLWWILSAVGLLALAPVGVWAVQPDRERPAWCPDRASLAVFSAAIGLSMSATFQRSIGQSSFLAALLLFAAIAWADRDKPIRAGLALALASLKVGTLIAFLTLFLRKKDARVWAAMLVAGLLFVLATTRPSQIPVRLRENLAKIRLYSQEGEVNDYSPRSPESLGLLTIGMMAYHLGLRNRGSVTAVEMAGSVAILGWLAWRIRTVPWSRAAQASIVACGSLLFLYHRGYDAVILALPLVYASGRGQVAPPGAKGYYRGAALTCLAALFIPGSVIRGAMDYALRGGWGGGVVEAAIVPLIGWCVIATLVLLVEAERRSSLPAGAPSSPGPL